MGDILNLVKLWKPECYSSTLYFFNA